VRKVGKEGEKVEPFLAVTIKITVKARRSGSNELDVHGILFVPP
jgi:hypothetical protein